MINDPLAISQLAQLDREGELDGIKAILEPRDAEAEERFLGDAAAHLTAILGLCVALGTITGAVGGIADMVTLANKLAAWVKERRSGGAEAAQAELTLRERLLMLLFEATTNREEGLSEAKLGTLLGCRAAEVTEALSLLESRGVARKSLQGMWKYAHSAD